MATKKKPTKTKSKTSTSKNYLGKVVASKSGGSQPKMGMLKSKITNEMHETTHSGHKTTAQLILDKEKESTED